MSVFVPAIARGERSAGRVALALALALAWSSCGAAPGVRDPPASEAPAPAASAALDIPAALDATERRETRELVPGVVYTHVTRGRASERDFFTLELGSFVARQEAERLAAASTASGDDHARVERTRDGRRWRVRAGRFADRASAEAALAARGAAIRPAPGVDPDAVRASAHVVYTGEDGAPTTGPWSIHVLAIDLRAAGVSVAVALASDRVTGRATVERIARDGAAIAAVNGGYFVMEPVDGTPGDPAGVTVVDGALVSEAIARRSALVLLTGGRVRVDEIRTRIMVTGASGAVREADGIDRTPGLVRNCGGSGGDSPTEAPRHDFTCTDASELVVFDERYGARTPDGEGVEAVLAADGRVVEARSPRGGAIEPGARVVAATGDLAAWLRAEATRGALLRIEERVRDAHDAPLPAGASVVNGGPRLVRDGAIDVRAADEGWDDPADPTMLDHFVLRRHPRTFAGVTADGRLLLVVADGRDPGRSVGLTLEEAAHVARSLGARDAVNLDGGGSSTMIVDGRIVNRPSDAGGAREVGDAILIRAASAAPR